MNWTREKTLDAGLWLRNAALSALLLLLSFRYLVFASVEKGWTSYGTASALTNVCILWFVVMVLLFIFTKKLPALLRVGKKDLVFVFIFLFIAGPLMLGSVYFLKQSTYAYRNAEASEVAARLLQQDLPRLVPANDAVAELYSGSANGRISWAPWLNAGGGVPPLVAWGVYILLFLGICFGLISIFSKRWIEDEQLAFPLARMSDLLIEGTREPGGDNAERLPMIASSRAFWIGAALTFAFQMCTYLRPGLEYRLGSFLIPDTAPLLGYLDYASRQFWWRPAFVAMFFMCPRPILKSVLVFHLLQIVFTIIGSQLGYKGYTGSAFPGAVPFPFKQDQLLGGAIALTGLLFWLSRRHIAAQWRAFAGWLVRRRPAPAEAGGQTPSPAVMAVLICSLAGFAAWTLLLGFSVKTMAIFLFCTVIAIVVNTRGRAEVGMPAIVVFSDFSPFGLISILGTKLIGFKEIAATAVHGWLFSNNIFHISPSLMDSLKIGQSARLSRGWVLSVAAAGVAAGILLGGYVSMASAYREGIDNWTGWGSGAFEAMRASQLMKENVPFNGLHGCFALVGGAVVSATWFLRSTFPGFGLHPLGYLLSLHSGLHHFSLALIIAYAAKSLSIHYGGMKTYIGLVPFFIGLMCGQIMGGTMAGVLNLIFDTKVYVPMF